MIVSTALALPIGQFNGVIAKCDRTISRPTMPLVINAAIRVSFHANVLHIGSRCSEVVKCVMQTTTPQTAIAVGAGYGTATHPMVVVRTSLHPITLDRGDLGSRREPFLRFLQDSSFLMRTAPSAAPQSTSTPRRTAEKYSSMS